MNAESLLVHYEKIADAPDAIARLRSFILDLAVLGKLVAQDTNDEPASELLKQIEREKVRLAKAGSISKPKQLLPSARDVVPFDVPVGWCYTRLGNIISLLSGQHLQPLEYSEVPSSGVPYITGPSDFTENGLNISRYALVRKAIAKRGQLLLTVKGSGVGKTTICDLPEVAISRQLMSLTPIMWNLGFLSIVTHRLAVALREQARSLIPGIAREDVENFTALLPPLAEQGRIVVKVDELMALCDQLETARTAQEATRDRLAAASLARLNSPDPETFADDAHFALDALPALTARPDQIKQLRQTILNLAVRGKLVPQDPKDEPAEELLKRIAEGKTAKSRVKRQDALPPIDLDQAPFDLPAGWAWGRFPELGTFGRGKSKHRPRNDPALFVNGNHLVIQTGDVARSKGLIQTYTSKYNDFGLAQSLKWPKGTMCITIAANIADSGILSFDACFPDSVVGFVPAVLFQNARYFEYFVRTAKANLLEFAPATAQKNINLDILNQVLIPLPPLGEQHRIVAKVDELMALCDQLEATLTITGDTRRQLLNALLAEALTPANDEHLQEAAE
ncbi:restriction endonuclease subunit S [Rhizobium leguminosarum]